MKNRWQQISAYLFIIPFLGIFVASTYLPFGPGADVQFYLTFTGLFLLLVVAGRAVFNYQTWHIKPIDEVWGVFVLYVIIQ